MATKAPALKIAYKTGENATCRCGCSEKVGAKSKFRQGHDARVKARLADQINAGGKIEVTVDGAKSEQTPKAFAKANFSETGQASMLALAEKRKANAAAKAEKERLAAAKKAATGTRAAAATVRQRQAAKKADDAADAAVEAEEQVPAAEPTEVEPATETEPVPA